MKLFQIFKVSIRFFSWIFICFITIPQPAISTSIAYTSEHPDLTEYIGETLENVVFLLDSRSINIDWASHRDQFQIISYKESFRMQDDIDQKIIIKCFFKKGSCFGKAINIPTSINNEDLKSWLELEDHQTDNPYVVELVRSGDHYTIYLSKSRNDLLMKLNSEPLIIEPVSAIIKNSKIINRYFWGSLQVGFPFYESLFQNFGGSLSYSSDRNDILYILQYKKTNYETSLIHYSIDELAYMSAYMLSKGKLRMTFCMGLSYLNWEEIDVWNTYPYDIINHSGLGVPIESQYYVCLNEHIGFGVTLRANLNSHSFYQFGFNILFGKVR